MARNNSTESLALHGFTIFQASLGAPLQFVPALHSAELDAMVDTYVAGSDTLQQKMAAVCVEFFSYAAQTGQTNDLQMFFPVFPQQQNTNTNSPASLGDSGYGSGFDVSPVAPEMMWDASFPVAPVAPAPATPSSAFSAVPNRVTKSKATAPSSRKGSTAITANDFSHIPGMKILTKDGVDVTNSASRGSKTKAMREHAHLIRLLKACDSCKKKKIRCDPSHKRKGANQPMPVTAATGAETTKASRKSKSASPPVTTPETPAAAAPQQHQASFHMAPAQASPSEAGMEQLLPQGEDFDWQQYLQLDEDVFSLPMDYDFVVDPQGFLTPSSGFSASPLSSSRSFTHQSFTPPSSAAAGLDLHGGFDAAAAAPAPRHIIAGFESSQLGVPQQLQQQPQLPYLQQRDGHGVSAGVDYIDFTLYSPASSFMDEEPQELQSAGSAFAASGPESYWPEERTAVAGAGHERIDLMQARRQHSARGGVCPVNEDVRGAFDADSSLHIPEQGHVDPGYSDHGFLHLAVKSNAALFASAAAAAGSDESSSNSNSSRASSSRSSPISSFSSTPSQSINSSSSDGDLVDTVAQIHRGRHSQDDVIPHATMDSRPRPRIATSMSSDQQPWSSAEANGGGSSSNSVSDSPRQQLSLQSPSAVSSDLGSLGGIVDVTRSRGRGRLALNGVTASLEPQQHSSRSVNNDGRTPDRPAVLEQATASNAAAVRQVVGRSATTTSRVGVSIAGSTISPTIIPTTATTTTVAAATTATTTTATVANATTTRQTTRITRGARSPTALSDTQLLSWSLQTNAKSCEDDVSRNLSAGPHQVPVVLNTGLNAVASSAIVSTNPASSVVRGHALSSPLVSGEKNTPQHAPRHTESPSPAALLSQTLRILSATANDAVKQDDAEQGDMSSGGTGPLQTVVDVSTQQPQQDGSSTVTQTVLALLAVLALVSALFAQTQLASQDQQQQQQQQLLPTTPRSSALLEKATSSILPILALWLAARPASPQQGSSTASSEPSSPSKQHSPLSSPSKSSSGPEDDLLDGLRSLASRHLSTWWPHPGTTTSAGSC